MRGSFDKPFSTSSSGERLCIFFSQELGRGATSGRSEEWHIVRVLSLSYGAMKCGQVTERFYYLILSITRVDPLSCLLSSQRSQIFRDFTNAPSHPLSAYILTLHLSMPACVRTQILHRSGLPALPPFLSRDTSPRLWPSRAMPGQRSSKYMDSQLQYQHDQCLWKCTAGMEAMTTRDDDGASQKWRRTPFEEERKVIIDAS